MCVITFLKKKPRQWPLTTKILRNENDGAENADKRSDPGAKEIL